MTLSRRRMLTLMAAALVPGGARAASQAWRGQAFGAEVSISITGPASRVDRDLAALIDRMRGIEAAFTLYDPTSQLRRLNAAGQGPLTPDLAALIAVSRRVHAGTGGLFDPTIQSLWSALSRGERPDRALIGLDRVTTEGGHLRMAPGMQLSFNGVAQGFAADVLRDMLRARGYARALVNMGEQAALGGYFRLGVEDPDAGPVGRLSIRNEAVATSSPAAMQIGGRDHILHPRGGAARWSTVSVVAPSAALADAASTAFCLMEDTAMRAAAQRLALRKVLIVDRAGDVRSL